MHTHRSEFQLLSGPDQPNSMGSTASPPTSPPAQMHAAFNLTFTLLAARETARTQGPPFFLRAEHVYHHSFLRLCSCATQRKRHVHNVHFDFRFLDTALCDPILTLQTEKNHAPPTAWQSSRVCLHQRSKSASPLMRRITRNIRKVKCGKSKHMAQFHTTHLEKLASHGEVNHKC